MSDAIKHECGIALLRLKKPISYYQEKYGTALFGILIDFGFTVDDIAVVSGCYIFFSLILLFLIRKNLNPVII